MTNIEIENPLEILIFFGELSTINLGKVVAQICPQKFCQFNFHSISWQCLRRVGLMWRDTEHYILCLIYTLKNCRFLAKTLNLAKLHNTFANQNPTATERLTEKWP
jgi:hypothetical protein